MFAYSTFENVCLSWTAETWRSEHTKKKKCLPVVDRRDLALRALRHKDGPHAVVAQVIVFSCAFSTVSALEYFLYNDTV